MPERVFVSYSHNDGIWRDRFTKLIGGGIYRDRFELWSDTRIEPDDSWDRTIEEAIAASKVALLLVSPSFLRSDFITGKELRECLRRRQAGGMSIFWVPIDPIPAELFKLAGLDGIQAAQPLCEPLSGLKDEAEYEQAILTVATKLIQHIDLITRTPKGLVDELRERVDRALREADVNTTIVEPIASGDFSIYFKAKQQDNEVVVKALVPSPSRAWLAKDFVTRANVVGRIKNSTAINIREVIDTPAVQCVVVDYVSAPTLEARLQQDKTLPSSLVVEVLVQLVRLAGHVHAMDGQHLVGPVRPSHVHYDAALNKAFISLIPIANETLEQCRDQPTRLIDSKALPYLSPELYYGRPLDASVDQYYLGLLALELLQGRPPVSIEAFVHLRHKAAFFRRPARYFDKAFRENDPAFSFVLARMLDCHAEHRWPSTAELEQALRQIAAGRVPDVVRQHVDDQYTSRLGDNPAFFAAFYQRFTKTKEIGELFAQRQTDMAGQHRKLNDAMANVLNFTSGLRTSTLERHVKQHRDMLIKPEHFDVFKTSFLGALPSAGINDEPSQDAWRAVLNPALEYMRSHVCDGSRAGKGA